MYEELLSLIMAKCQREGWYGPEDFKHRRAAFASNISFHNGFAFPPATPQQLRETEDFLGFSLPLLLGILYTQLANGGFGPGAGIRGAVGGYGNPNTFENGSDETIAKEHAYGEGRLVDLNRFAHKWKRSGGRRTLDIPSDVWPRQLFPICDLGCVQEVCLDREGYVFLRASSWRNFVCTISDRGMSLEDWLWGWLKGKPSHSRI